MSSPIGQVLAGCSVERLLARGGMGAVYLAKREADGERVVLKLLAPELASDRALRERFRQEGEALLRMGPHPNIVRVHALHEVHGQPCLELEYVAGESLRDVLARDERLPWSEALGMGLDVATGLAAAHAHGLIHRDVTPGNVLIASAGPAKIADFGLAKDIFATGVTAPGELFGTGAYMAPELWEEEREVDARADIFALGATLYTALVGRPPFEGEDLAELVDRIEAGEYPRPSDLVPGLPDELERVIGGMLEPELRHRYPLMRVVAEDLERVRRGETCQLPALELVEGEARAPRLPIPPGARVDIGRDTGCDLVLTDRSVSRRHARLVREPGGFVLSDLGSRLGTTVNKRKLIGAQELRDGDMIELGAATFCFHEPLAQMVEPAFRQDVTRVRIPDPLLQALIDRADDRVTAHLLERLEPNPQGLVPLREELQSYFGLRTSLEVGKRVDARCRRAMPAVRERLMAICGDDTPRSTAGWLEWWDASLLEYPLQVTSSPPHCTLRLEVIEGVGDPGSLEVDDRGLTLLGRDVRCDLQVQDRTASRLHARVRLLHGRLALRDRSRYGLMLEDELVRAGFWDPGDVVQLGETRLQLVRETYAPALTRVGTAGWWVDADVFWNLVEFHHKATATGLVGLMFEPRRDGWIDEEARTLFPDEPNDAKDVAGWVRGAYQERIERARAALPRILGEDHGDDVAAWSAALARNRTALPAQLLPAGWLRATRPRATR